MDTGLALSSSLVVPLVVGIVGDIGYALAANGLALTFLETCPLFRHCRRAVPCILPHVEYIFPTQGIPLLVNRVMQPYRPGRGTMGLSPTLAKLPFIARRPFTRLGVGDAALGLLLLA